MKTEIPYDNLLNNMFSEFGTYQLDDKMVFRMPNNTVTLQHIGNDRFSCIRNSSGLVVKKIIQARPQTSKIEVVPVLPIHVPSRKTDFFFIRFDETLFIEQNSTLSVETCIPIEVGMFLVTHNKSSGFDFFSCDPLNSRFGLYGTPEDGKLCKYSAVSANNTESPQPFSQARLKIEITNELHELASVGKIVFPITDHDLYYYGNDVIMDGLRATIKNRVGLHVIETVQDPIAKPENWRLTPRDTEKTDYKFSMERGFD